MQKKVYYEKTVTILLAGINGFSQTTTFNITSALPIFQLHGGSYYYRVTGVTVSTAGTYTIKMDSGDDLDTYLLLHDRLGFNPNYPLINEIAENDDDDLGGSFYSSNRYGRTMNKNREEIIEPAS